MRGEGGSDEVVQGDRRQATATRNACLGLGVQAPGQEETSSRIIFAAGGSIPNTWKKQEGSVDQRLPFMPLDEVLATSQGDTSHRRGMHTHDLIRHVLILCAARVPQGRPPRGNMARQLFDPLPRTEKGKEKGTFWQIERSVAKTVERWRDRRECVSEPPSASLNWLRR